MMFPHPNASHVHWWNQSEPLWVTAEKQGVRTAVYWWDGCQVPIRNTTPTYCLEYQSYWTWPKPKEDTIEAMKEILDNFQRNEWQLGLVYYEAVDATGNCWQNEQSCMTAKCLPVCRPCVGNGFQRENRSNERL